MRSVPAMLPRIKSLPGFLASGATLRDLVCYFEDRVPKLRELRPSLALALNQEYACLERELRTGDEVGFLPPVSGGSGDGRRETRVAIVREKIDTQRELEAIKEH